MRRWPEQETIQDIEHRPVRGNAKGEREHDTDGKHRRSAELSQCESAIGQRGRKAVAAARASDLAKRAGEHRATGLADVTELSECFRARSLRRNARFDQLSLARFEMRGNLGVDVTGDSGTPKEEAW